MSYDGIPIPPHFDPEKVNKIWKVPYQDLMSKAEEWAKKYNITPSFNDTCKICLIAVDVQNTFCIPGFELYVGGRSGTGAVDDNRRLCEFIYRNIDVITQICPTMDTHSVMQIFHSLYLINDKGEHPEPFTLISTDDVENGIWKFNPNLCSSLKITAEYGQRHLLHYTKSLKESGKYNLTIWPFHAMLGGIGHALVSSFEEAVFFHSIVRYSQPDFHIKGDKPFTEHYSVIGPEVIKGPDNEILGNKSEFLFKKLLGFDAVIIAGQAKSHCLTWTIDDLLQYILATDKKLTEKIYLLEDCSSPVVIPDVIDFTEKAEEAFRRFSDHGMHIVRTNELIKKWDGIKL